MLYQGAPPETIRAFHSYGTVLCSYGSQASFLCAVFFASCKERATLAKTETRDTTRDEAMTKKQNTGLVLMLASAAVGIQLTLFIPILRGWFYSICLAALIIVFVSGADLFRGNE
jgi:F0F1-type ATP synthase assembly protein I